MADLIVCVDCGNEFPRYEELKKDGRLVDFDWTTVSDPKCPACRGLPMPEVRKRDVLGGFPWKRDKDGKKVPR